MTRLERKCVIASSGLHALLMVVIVFGAAFGTKPPPEPFRRINVIPDIFKPGPPGGGGVPELPRTEELVKGNTTTPQPAPPPEPVKPVQPPQARTEPTPPPKPTVAKPAVKPADAPKLIPVVKAQPKPETLPLVPIVRTDTARAKAKAEAEAREAARVAANAAASHRRELANRVGQLKESLQTGFNSGTVVMVGGDGGPAHADYAQLVEAIYRGALQNVTDFSDQDFTVKVEVVIARTGRVVSSRIARRSGNAVMDRAVQRALDKVEREGLGRPFPPEMPEAEHKYTFDYSFRARKATG